MYAIANDACSSNVLIMHINILVAFHIVNYWCSDFPKLFTVNAAFPPDTVQLFAPSGFILPSTAQH